MQGGGIYCTCDDNPTWLQVEAALRRFATETPADRAIELSVPFFFLHGPSITPLEIFVIENRLSTSLQYAISARRTTSYL